MFPRIAASIMIIQAGNCRRDMARIDAIPNGTCGGRLHNFGIME